MRKQHNLTQREFAEENMLNIIREAENTKKNIVGGKVLGNVVNVDMNVNEIHKSNIEFWDTIGNEFLGTTSLPSLGGYLPSKDKLNLLGKLSGKRVLEICCGSGRSFKYVADLGAADLWGLDISKNQLERAKAFLKEQKINAKLVHSPMEDECGLPTDYFDIVFSVYGIGIVPT